MTVNMLIGLLFGLVLGATCGYRYGKRVTFELLRIHLDNGLSFKRALDYEEDVERGRVPRG